MNKTSFVSIAGRNRKPIVLFGSGNIASKTLRRLDSGTVAFIADNSANLHGTRHAEIEIRAPKAITRDHFVIICSTAITAISEQLESMGFEPDRDFVISPILNDLLAISDLERLDQTVYFTSGTVPVDDPQAGGGLYRCRVRGPEVSLEKLYSGPCYGMTRRGQDLIFVDTDNGVFRYAAGGVSKLGDLPHGSRAHGISYHSDNDRYYVSCSELDAVLEFDSDFRLGRRFELSGKFAAGGEAVHHCNDNLARGNSLYVSMFSSTGNWKSDCFDGCVAEFDLQSGQRLTDICRDLYMPHNIQHINGSLHVLDSLPGHLRYGNFSVQGTFPAFARGLDFSEGLYYVGQSKNRNYSKVLGLSNNISIDCGVVVFNPELKVSRLLQFPHAIGEVHAVVAGD